MSSVLLAKLNCAGRRQRRRASTFKRSNAATALRHDFRQRHYEVVIFLLTQHFTFVISRAIFKKHSGTWRSSGQSQSQSLRNDPWLVILAILILLFAARQPSTAQTAEAGQVTVTGEPVPTPTSHDNWREMRQHIMPEVSGTEITVTKKATVIKLDQQPPIENNDLQDLLILQGISILPEICR